MTKEKESHRWLNVRVPTTEHQRLQQLYQSTTCRTFSEFIRAVLLSRKIITTTRNQSLDDAVAELSKLRAELNAIGKNINQVVKILHAAITPRERNFAMDTLTRHLEQFTRTQAAIQQQINGIAGQWLQESGSVKR